MVQRSGYCLGHELGEIVVAVKMPRTRNGTKRPHEPLLQLSIGIGQMVCRIGGRLRFHVARHGGVVGEIPPFIYLMPNPRSGDIVWWVV